MRLKPDFRGGSSVLLSLIACSLQDEDLRAVHETVAMAVATVVESKTFPQSANGKFVVSIVAFF